MPSLAGRGRGSGDVRSQGMDPVIESAEREMSGEMRWSKGMDMLTQKQVGEVNRKLEASLFNRFKSKPRRLMIGGMDEGLAYQMTEDVDIDDLECSAAKKEI